VVVTGSRIARPEIDLPTPVAVVGADTLKRAGTDSIGAILAQQPTLSFAGSPQAGGHASNSAFSGSKLPLRASL
jgi:outer membrane cobalamin receptor